MTAWLRCIFRSESQAEARQALQRAPSRVGRKGRVGFPDAGGGLEDAIAAGPTGQISQAPSDHQAWPERLIEEIRRRERVIRIFPNSALAHRLVGVLLQEQHEEWLTGRKYFDMNEYFEWRQQALSRTPSEKKGLRIWERACNLGDGGGCA